MALEWFYEPGRVEAGVDEAGRGCLAGPVVAAAVIWASAETRPDVVADKRLKLVRDSKTLSAAQRMKAREFIQSSAVAWAVASASVGEIDDLNILRASHRAMHRALDLLHGVGSPTDCEVSAHGGDATAVEFVLADGDRFDSYMSPTEFVPHACFTSGDNRYLAIAAASILAKTYRDEYVCNTLHARFPLYGWDSSKGYGTAAHMQALEQHGACEQHRRSFAPVSRVLRAQGNPDARVSQVPVLSAT